MPQFWKIDATQWINPAHIVHIKDNPTREPPHLVVLMATVESSVRESVTVPYALTLEGLARERVLQYLTRDAALGEPEEPA
jgi:hypothetical protein